MKNITFKFCTIVAISMSILSSCSKNNIDFQDENQTQFGTISTNIQYDENVRHELALSMVEFKTKLSPYYLSNQTFEQFKEAIFNTPNQSLSSDANNLILITYLILEDGMDDNYIIENYLGGEMAKIMLFLKDNQNSDGAEFFNLTSQQQIEALGCKWYQVGCHIQRGLDWIEKNAKALGVIIQSAAVVVAVHNAFK